MENTSPSEGYEKVIHMVVSLDGVKGADEENKGRLDRFRSKWESSCGPRIHFQVCPGNLSPITGVGLTKSFSACLKNAHNQGADAVFMYEDDALLFDPRFCSLEYQRKFLLAAPEDALVLLLGGHDFVIDWDSNDSQQTPSAPFVKLIQSYGTYGYAVTRSNMPSLSSLFSEQATSCVQEARKCSPDVSFYHLARSYDKHIYAVNPLLVDHDKGTYSNTWKKLRSSTKTGEVWMGNRNVYEAVNPNPNLNIK
mmetsp:Transcript_3104/g.6250  ORF Transcript_3104/g.6250 Transcript_3104/m.6250 type:complete len:252 (+) Transcript_3104:257-1012(+)